MTFSEVLAVGFGAVFLGAFVGARVSANARAEAARVLKVALPIVTRAKQLRMLSRRLAIMLRYRKREAREARQSAERMRLVVAAVQQQRVARRARRRTAP